MEGPVVLGDTFRRALAYACDLHAADTRKGKPWLTYLSHLLGVATITLELGGDEEQAAAALLHDAIEDHPAASPAARIRASFGARVERIVLGCSDSTTEPKPPWRERKERYIEHLAAAEPDVLLVSYADKLHNARSILEDVRRAGAAALEVFTGGPAGALWYYRAVTKAFRARGMDVAELDRAVDEVASIVEEP